MNSEPLTKKEAIALELFKVMMRDLDYNHPFFDDQIKRAAAIAAYQASCLVDEVNRQENKYNQPEELDEAKERSIKEQLKMRYV